MTEWLHFHFSLSCIGERNGNPLQCSCLENPRDRGAWWAAVYGVAQSWTRLKWLSSSSSNCNVGMPVRNEHLKMFCHFLLQWRRKQWGRTCSRISLLLSYEEHHWAASGPQPESLSVHSLQNLPSQEEWVIKGGLFPTACSWHFLHPNQKT